MGTQYGFSIKDAEDATSVDAGIEGWDAIIQINNVISRRYAASTPVSLISRQIDFRGTTDTGGGTGGLQLDTSGVFTLLDIGSLGTTSKATNLLFVPTMVGLMVHPQTDGAMTNAFAASIGVRNSNTGSTALLTASFSLSCSAHSLSSAAINGVSTLTTVSGNNPGVVQVPTTTLPAVGIASNRKGYYYLCPVNKGWWQQPDGNFIGGMPMRGFTVQNDSISPFIPDGGTTDADIHYASNTSYNQLVLVANGGTNNARFAIIDLYGIIIPSASAVA